MRRILIADGNPVLRSALALLLETRLKSQIVALVDSSERLLIKAADASPDIVILDCELPGETCAACIAHLRRLLPQARIIVASAYLEAGNRAEDADALVCKFDPPENDPQK